MKLVASIIVLNYNGQKILSETIDSLLNLNFDKTKFEIVVADNKSTDNSQQIIDTYSGQIRSLKLDKNYGFAGGNNRAIKTCSSSYIVLLNNDCIVDKNWLTELVKTADSNQNIFSVSSKLLRYPSESKQVQNAGSLVFSDGYGRDIGAIVTTDHQQLYESDANQFKTRPIYSSCGAAVLYRHKLLSKIGLLDENFFMYYEDTEISERAMLNGYTNYYCNEALVYHHHSASSVEWSPFFIYHVEKGRLLHLIYHFPITIFTLEYIKFTYKSFLRLAYSIIKKRTEISRSLSYIKVIFSILFNLPKYLLQRSKQIYSPKARLINYQKILSGYWYFN